MPLFKKATKFSRKLRMALAGPSGSGKTKTALYLASGLGERIALIDTERGGANYYADQFSFDTLELTSFHPERYIEALAAAAEERYEVVIIDSLSHAWAGKDGALELVDRAAKRSQSGNSFAAWRDVTPLHNKLVEALLQSPFHLLVTLRSKTEYVLESDGRGKQVPKKVGMAPVQRDGLEYEFDLVGDLDYQHILVVTKSRIDGLADLVIERPGMAFGTQILTALTTGAVAPPPAPPAENPTPPPPRPSVDRAAGQAGASFIAQIEAALYPKQVDYERFWQEAEATYAMMRAAFGVQELQELLKKARQEPEPAWISVEGLMARITAVVESGQGDVSVYWAKNCKRCDALRPEDISHAHLVKLLFEVQAYVAKLQAKAEHVQQREVVDETTGEVIEETPVTVGTDEEVFE